MIILRDRVEALDPEDTNNANKKPRKITSNKYDLCLGTFELTEQKIFFVMEMKRLKYIRTSIYLIKQYLKKRLCVGCAKGFKIIDMDSLATQALLDPADASLHFVQNKENVKPIAIFRIPNSDRDLLLCYDD
ncbi:71_t:CDS:2 [Ambispora leptoticha]|uniref:71_t:CDS:1 n=1 Tax=Ambispora leptoticha TaxID=144679 RepID=A0A9N9FAU2_9GLOM|nr:71_t:CDS:2 [Ambispora leptoticha]